MSNLTEKQVTWKEFKLLAQEAIDSDKASYSKVLFRGQSNAEWGLVTTLERITGREDYPCDDYYKDTLIAEEKINSFARESWGLPTLAKFDASKLKLGGFFGFSVEEFTDSLPASNLLRAVSDSDIVVPNGGDDIDKLNSLLKIQGLRNQFLGLQPPHGTAALIKRETKLTENELMLLNRLVLEAVYPQQCPKNQFNPPQPVIEYWVYLRHHGFPSPLLDWSSSPYVAAFFAFCDIDKVKKSDAAAIYLYHDKGLAGSGAMIHTISLTTAINERHHRQQVNYTYRMAKQAGINSFVTHNAVDANSDLIPPKKFIIPYSEQEKILEELESMDINKYSLFDSLEGLNHSLAVKRFVLGNKK